MNLNNGIQKIILYGLFYKEDNQDFFLDDDSYDKNFHIQLEGEANFDKIENRVHDSVSYISNDKKCIKNKEKSKSFSCSFEVLVEPTQSCYICRPTRSLISRPFKKTRHTPIWSEAEKIVFFGVVIFMYCHRHSHKVSVREREESAGKGSVAWQHISIAFCQAKHRLSEMSSFKNEKRSVSAIQKCWKESKHKEECNYNEEPSTKKRVKYFDLELNKENILLCSKVKYLNKKEKVEKFVWKAFKSIKSKIKRT